MKVLMSSFACEPNRGSEPGVGWNWAIQAARFHDVWVLTRKENATAVERALDTQPNGKLHFIYFDLPWWLGWTHWEVKGGVRHRIYYLLWQLLALPPAFEAHRRQRFDVIHHVTYNTVDVPGFLWSLPVPFVWGPVGGAQVPPAQLKEYYGGRWRMQLLRSGRKKLLRFNPIVRMAIRKSSIILTANADAERLVRRLGAKKTCRMLEAGVHVGTYQDQTDQDDGSLSIIWTGKLEHRKAPTMALEVLQGVLRENVAAQLWMVGDGPLRSEIEAAAGRYGLGEHVHLTGWVPHPTVQEIYAKGDVFLFTSLQDTSGNVVLEAMAQGLPVVALKHHGVAEMVTSDSGVLVSIESREQVVRDMVVALKTLAEHTELRQRMSHAARQRVEEVYDWNWKGMFLVDIYNEVVEGTPKPESAERTKHPGDPELS